MKVDPYQRIRRLQLNFRRVNITFIGDAGRPWRRACAVLLAIVALVLIAVFSRTQPQLMSSAEVLSIQERGMLRVGVRYDVPGMGGEEGGLEHELAELLAARILPEADPNARLRLVEVNSMTMGTKLDDGSVDVVIAMAGSAMSSQYHYSASYYSDPCVLVARRDAGHFELADMEIGAVQSNKLRTSPERLLLLAYIEAHPSMRLKATAWASYPDMLGALQRGQLPVALLPQLYVARYEETYDIVDTGFSPGNIDYAICSGSDSAVLAEIGTRMLEELRQSGELQRLYMKHGLPQQLIQVVETPAGGNR
ncbi:MAG: transporter substrate-binding domain-containing protein [Christensenellaceae bacterium]|jgi:ABC-type amino acid transport substrate-binding protein|nr:transporter substrate-binding domain-containing protein [Christensenellaceae bacterium]